MTTIPESLRGQAPAIAAVVPPLAAAVNDTGRTVWCGPVAVSALTGAPASEIEAAIRHGRAARADASPAPRKSRRRTQGDRDGAPDPVVGTSAADVQGVLAGLGWDMRLFWQPLDGARVTLAQWLERPRLARVDYLIGLMARREPHWVALRGVMLADTYSGGQWGWAIESPHRRARLLDVWAVARREGEARP